MSNLRNELRKTFNANVPRGGHESRAKFQHFDRDAARLEQVDELISHADAESDPVEALDMLTEAEAELESLSRSGSEWIEDEIPAMQAEIDRIRTRANAEDNGEPEDPDDLIPCDKTGGSCLRYKVIATYRQICAVMGGEPNAPDDPDKVHCSWSSRRRAGGNVAIWDWKEPRSPANCPDSLFYFSVWYDTPEAGDAIGHALSHHGAVIAD